MKPVYQAKWFDKSSAALTVFFAAVVSAPISVQAAPEGYTPVRGDTSLAGNTLTVREDRSIVEWSGGFNIAAGEAFNINHDGGQSSWVILNRDTSGLASQLDGQLNANMRVYLLNSSGVVLGSGAQLNVPSAVLSGLALSDTDFAAGVDQFALPAGQTSGGFVIVRGLGASDGADIVLLGNKIIVDGNVSVPGGRLSALAADTITVDLNGDGLMQFALDAGLAAELLGAGEGQGDAIHVSANANIQAQSINLHARVAEAALRTAVNTRGVIAAQGVDTADGEVILRGDSGLALVQGEVSAAASDASARGVISLNADDVILGATLSADELEIAIGGSGNGGSLTVLPTAASSVAQQIIVGGAGSDSVQGFSNWAISEVNGGRASRSGMGDFIWSGVEAIGGTPGRDQVVVSATGSVDTINTGADSDVVIIAGAVDTVMTGDNDDFVLLNGEGQATLVDGGNGIDSLSGLPQATVTGFNRGTASNVAQWESIENLQGTAGADSFTVAPEGQLDGRIDAGAGDDRVLISGTVTSVSGGDNDDVITVDGGTVSLLEGNNGDDVFLVQGGMVNELDGGAGFDSLSGVTDPQPLSPPVDGSGSANEVVIWRSIENLVPAEDEPPVPVFVTPANAMSVAEFTPNPNVFDAPALSDLSLGLLGQSEPTLRLPCDQWLIPPTDDSEIDDSCKQQEDPVLRALLSDLGNTNIFFATNIYAISEADRQRLSEVAELFKRYEQLRLIKVRGYTDDVGTQNYNLALSNRRANSAAKVLESFGIDESSMQVVGYGETSPFVPNTSAAQRALNRRVTVELSIDE